MRRFNDPTEQRAAAARPSSEVLNRDKKHPAIEAAIDHAMKNETAWKHDLGAMSDDHLRERYLERQLDKDIARAGSGRASPLWPNLKPPGPSWSRSRSSIRARP